MRQHCDRLPWSLVRRRPDAVVVAVDLQARRLIQRRDAELLGSARDSKAFCQRGIPVATTILVPLERAGTSLGPYSERRSRRRYRSLQSVAGELAEFVNLFIEPVEHCAFPAARLAVAGHALDGVPTSAVGLPRHCRVAPDRL